MFIYCIVFIPHWIVWHEHNTVHKLFTSCIWQCLVSHACDWVTSPLSAVLLIFSFQIIQSAFLPCLSARHHSAVAYWFTQYQTLDVAENVVQFLVQSIQPRGNDFELILTVKMETRHPVEGSFGSEFLAICNQCVVMVAWSRKTLKFCQKFLHFLEKQPPYAKIFVHRALFTGQNKFWLPLKQSLLRGSCPKSARVSPQQCAHSAPDFIQSVHFQRSYSRTCEHRLLPHRVFRL